MTSPSSWQTSLHQLLNLQGARPRLAIVGIGNDFRCDDAAGVSIARRLLESRIITSLRNVLVIDAGHAPENRTADLRRFAPEVILLIDAADMDELPGTIRWIETDEIEGMSASTHTLPLSMLAKYLTLELNCKIAFIGIQLKSNDVGETLSTEVAEAVNLLAGNLIELLGSTMAADSQ